MEKPGRIEAREEREETGRNKTGKGLALIGREKHDNLSPTLSAIEEVEVILTFGLIHIKSGYLLSFIY
jgi:hypothetical protein